MCAFNFLVKGVVCFANYHYCAKGQDRFAMQGQKLYSSDFLKSVIHEECVAGTIQAYSKFMSGEKLAHLSPSKQDLTTGLGLYYFRKLILFIIADFRILSFL